MPNPTPGETANEAAGIFQDVARNAFGVTIPRWERDKCHRVGKSIIVRSESDVYCVFSDLKSYTYDIADAI